MLYIKTQGLFMTLVNASNNIRGIRYNLIKIYNMGLSTISEYYILKQIAKLRTQVIFMWS